MRARFRKRRVGSDWGCWDGKEQRSDLRIFFVCRTGRLVFDIARSHSSPTHRATTSHLSRIYKKFYFSHMFCSNLIDAALRNPLERGMAVTFGNILDTLFSRGGEGGASRQGSCIAIPPVVACLAGGGGCSMKFILDLWPVCNVRFH